MLVNKGELDHPGGPTNSDTFSLFDAFSSSDDLERYPEYSQDPPALIACVTYLSLGT